MSGSSPHEFDSGASPKLPTRKDVAPGSRRLEGCFVCDDEAEATFVPSKAFLGQPPLWRIDVLQDRLVANSPAALEGYLGMSGALAKGSLPAATRERIALAVAQINDCGYCLSAHSYLGKNLAKLSDAEITANRHGGSLDPKADAAVRFAAKVVRERGHVSDADVQAVRMAGYDDAQIVEIVQHVALNTWTNYVNSVAQTEIDFPSRRPWPPESSQPSHEAALPGLRRPPGPRPRSWRPCHVPPAAAAVHARNRHPEGPPGRRLLEWS